MKSVANFISKGMLLQQKRLISAKIHSVNLVRRTVGVQSPSQRLFNAQILSMMKVVIDHQESMQKVLMDHQELTKKVTQIIEDQTQGLSQTFKFCQALQHTLISLTHASAERDLRTTFASKIREPEFHEFLRRCGVSVDECMLKFPTPVDPYHEGFWCAISHCSYTLRVRGSEFERRKECEYEVQKNKEVASLLKERILNGPACGTRFVVSPWNKVPIYRVHFRKTRLC